MTMMAAKLVKSIAVMSIAIPLAFVWPAQAQAPQDPHHPEEPAAPPAASVSPGMMMQGGGMPMMNMMMSMMRQGSMGMSEMTMPGMDMADRVEGRIAFLRAELKITDAQTKAWDDFANALRDNAKKLGDARGAATPGSANTTPPLVKQLEQQERWYIARLDGIRKIIMAFDHLYLALSDNQQKSADGLMGPHLGLTPMGTMSMGGTSAGGMPMGGMSMPGSRL